MKVDVAICTRSSLAALDELPNGREVSYVMQRCSHWLHDVHITSGLTDVALARNVMFTRLVKNSKADSVIFLDDDIIAGDWSIEELILSHLEADGAPVSGIYCPRAKPDELTVGVCRDGHFNSSQTIPIAGLGFCIVRLEDLRAVVDSSSELSLFDGGEVFREVTWSGGLARRWVSEDVRFWLRMFWELASRKRPQLKFYGVTVGHAEGKRVWLPSDKAQGMRLDCVGGSAEWDHRILINPPPPSSLARRQAHSRELRADVGGDDDGERSVD